MKKKPIIRSGVGVATGKGGARAKGEHIVSQEGARTLRRAAPFINKSPEAAKRGRGNKAIKRERHVLEVARQWLNSNEHRFGTTGEINLSSIARKYRNEFGTHLSEKRIREILAKAFSK